MSSSLFRRLISLFRRAKGTSATSPSVLERADEEQLVVANPVNAYYRHKAKNNLRVFYRFAIQSRSLAIRDEFAKASSIKNLNLSDLLVLIGQKDLELLPNEEVTGLQDSFDCSILLALADLLANTARSNADTLAAVEVYSFVDQLYGSEPFSEQQLLLYVEALSDSGNHEKAQQLASRHSINTLAPYQRELLELQRIRHEASSIAEWIDTLNGLCQTLNMTKVALLDDDSLPYMDRLTAHGALPVHGPKVSVIMPTFSPGPSIRTAVRSVLQQSWTNLELIIVNDASPSQYEELFHELEQLDHRVQVIHQTSNRGAYVARNTGLGAATGTFVTTADDDDWSHPDKLAIQVSIMLDNPSVVATTSGHIRITEDLELRRLNSSAKFLQMNYSSLMFRKWVVSEIGGWDTVNRGADSEFYSRISEYYGKDRIVNLLDKPLGLSRVRSGSLTSGEMYRGFIGTPRVLYLWAIRQWRWDLGKKGHKPRLSATTVRPFAVPSNFEAGKRRVDLGHFDVIYVTDFFRQAKQSDHALKEIQTLSENGFRVGYMHMYSPETARLEGFPKELFDLQLQSKIVQVSHEDMAETELLLVYGSAIGMFADQISSNLKSHRSLVIEHTPPRLSKRPARHPTLLPEALKNLNRTFNTDFKILSDNSEEHKQLHKTLSASRLGPERLVWEPHVRGGLGKIDPPMGKPVVGFHTFGNRYRWPSNEDHFREVYISPNYKTRFLGNLEPATARFGTWWLEKVDVIEDASENEFLSSLDFWVYYPHSRLLDKVWEPVLKAMQAGKVVLLPPRLETLYGNGAIYVSEHDVDSVIADYASDPSRYRRQARHGQDLIRTRYSERQLIDRVASITQGRDCG